MKFAANTVLIKTEIANNCYSSNCHSIYLECNVTKLLPIFVDFRIILAVINCNINKKKYIT